MTFTASCPICGHKCIEGEQFDGTAVCPECHAMLEANHDCHYDPESGDDWCCDWWEHNGGFRPPTPHRSLAVLNFVSEHGIPSVAQAAEE